MRATLYQWFSAFNGTSFADSDSGRALYGYLLFKNGLKLTGLEILFTSHPGKINPILISLWQTLLEVHQEVWTITNIQLSGSWVNIFGSSAEIRVLARRFDSQPGLAEFEELLRKTSANSWERHWIQWNYITSLLMKGGDAKAAKLLKHLQGVTENNPVSQDLMNLTAARMLYQNGYLIESIRYYKKVKKGSDYWFEALEEMGWTELRLGQPQNTLAHVQTLLAPDFESDVGPETYYLASLASLKICDYEVVSKTIKSFKNRFQARVKKLLKLKEQPETRAFGKLFSELTKGRTGRTSLGGFSPDLPRYSMRDENLYFLVQRQNQLDREAETAKKLYSQSLSGGTLTVGFQAGMEKFRTEISARVRKNYNMVLGWVKILADREITEISKTLKKMKVVEVELIQQLSLVERVIVDTKELKARAKKGTTGAQGKYTMSFLYRGEWWYDELSNYQVNVNKICGSGKHL